MAQVDSDSSQATQDQQKLERLKIAEAELRGLDLSLDTAQEQHKLAKQTLDDHEAQLRALRDEANAAKREIADWKSWYETLDGDRKPTELLKLTSQIARLAQKLGRIEAEISPLQNQTFELASAEAIASAKAEALQAEGCEGLSRLARTTSREIGRTEQKIAEASGAKS